MILINNLALIRWLFMLNLVTYSIFSGVNCIEEVSASPTGKCTVNSELNKSNRDGKLPTFPLEEDLRVKSSYIYKAHEILSNALKQFLKLNYDADLGTYLGFIVKQNIDFTDDFGQEYSSFQEVFTDIWEQYNETLCENYAFKQFDNDKLDLCAVARYLSNQPAVKDGETLINRMAKALKYEYDSCAVNNCVFCKRDDFKPCIFSHGDLKCELVRPSEIHNVFKKSGTYTLKTVKITLNWFDYSIGADIFARKRISNLVFAYEKVKRNDRRLTRDNLDFILTWDSSDTYVRVRVHANAFRYSKSSMKSLEIQSFDGIRLDLSFLTGFNQLINLTFKDAINIHHCLRTLPELPNLILLDCHSCSGLGNFYWVRRLVNGLKYTAFWPMDEYERNGDQTINDILNWLLISSSDSLEYITIERFRSLTKVPEQISWFKSLKHLSLQNNGIEAIGSGSFKFSAPVIYLDLQNNGIKVIEKDAFQGNFKKAYFNINNNKLNRFEASAFRRIVHQMDGGVFYATGNPIDCSDLQICHLAWLIRDERLKLDKNIINGTCSNGTSFKMLSLAKFNHC